MSSTGTIRHANESDLPEIRRLLMRDERYLSSDEKLLTTVTPGTHLLVLDHPKNGLVAAALFHIVDRRGHLLMMVVSADCYNPRAIEARMFGVVEAMCTAFGSTTVDVMPQSAAS